MNKYFRSLVPLIVVIFYSCTQSDSLKPNFIGKIPSDPSLDTLNFKPCNEKMLPYYTFTSKSLYEGEKLKIVSHFSDNFKKVSDETGYVTIRFIVNCHGETGRFRLIGLDENYQTKKISKSLTDQLLKLTMTLDGWKSELE